ncbi:unnamed protein product [Diamesa tonsa]
MNNLKLITFLLIAVAVTATLSAPSRPCPCKKSHPVLVKYRDEDGNIRMTMVKQPKPNQQELSSWGSDSNVSEDSSEEASHEESADLQKYAERDGPHEDSDDMNEKYNISDEDDMENAEVYNESDDGHVYGHPYNPNIHSSESSEEQEASVPKKDCHHKKSPKPQPHSNKRVYVYKQPPIIVNPKPTNVYIRSKPIVVRPPPLVVHQADPKPCNPIIKYQPPNIKIRPIWSRTITPYNANSASDSEEEYVELNVDSIEIPKYTTKREVSGYNNPLIISSSRTHFYNLLLGVLDTMHSSSKSDIRRAKEKQLQRRSVQIIL